MCNNIKTDIFSLRISKYRVMVTQLLLSCHSRCQYCGNILHEWKTKIVHSIYHRYYSRML